MGDASRLTPPAQAQSRSTCALNLNTTTILMPEITYQEVETRSNPRFTVIWLHGLGADGSDFVPVVDELGLDTSAGVRFIFPDAPHRAVTCNGGYVMRAWYDILSLAPENREIDEEGLIESVDMVRQFIAREAERGIPSERIFLAGFSQGGAVAYTTALTHPTPLGGLIALSTYIPSAPLVTRHLAEANRQLPIFAAHGSEDSVVGIRLGEQAIRLVEACGNVPCWRTYPMGHEVCAEEIDAIGQWLNERMATLCPTTPQPGITLQPYAAVQPYVTKDGSEIRELMHPKVHGNAAQSLAEARIPPGTRTALHRHRQTEEIYHITAGTGVMTLGGAQFPVAPGDTVLIPPGTPHAIQAADGIALRILCCCSPAYDHDDTELL